MSKKNDFLENHSEWKNEYVYYNWGQQEESAILISRLLLRMVGTYVARIQFISPRIRKNK